MKVMTMRDVKPRMNKVIWGPPGCGKTTLAATAQDHPQMGDVLFIDIEGGLVSCAHRGDIRFVDVKTNEDGTPCLDVIANMEAVYWNIVQKKPGFDTIGTVVIDSVTELQQMDLANIAAIEYEKYKKKIADNPRKMKTIKPVVKDRISLDYYGLNTSRMKRILRMYRDGPFNLICTALMKKRYDSESETAPPTEIGPSLTPGVSDSLRGMVDFCWALYLDGNTRKLMTAPTGVYQVKTRGPRFQAEIGDTVTNPHLGEMYDAYVNSIKGEM